MRFDRPIFRSASSITVLFTGILCAFNRVVFNPVVARPFGPELSNAGDVCDHLNSQVTWLTKPVGEVCVTGV